MLLVLFLFPFQGKTTLMDVLAMRKSSGEIEGEIRLNGHLQEENSFRRCMGYVEQFDVQSPQLTIRETVEFSAKMRLEETDPTVTPESITKFVAQTLKTLELTNLQDLQVGSDAGGGLSFEQKKRLSIAVEVAANPSVLFLVSSRLLRLQETFYALAVTARISLPFFSTLYF
jgi:ABC-type multidrug transport system ATPase subunit